MQVVWVIAPVPLSCLKRGWMVAAVSVGSIHSLCLGHVLHASDAILVRQHLQTSLAHPGVCDAAIEAAYAAPPLGILWPHTQVAL